MRRQTKNILELPEMHARRETRAHEQMHQKATAAPHKSVQKVSAAFVYITASGGTGMLSMH